MVNSVYLYIFIILVSVVKSKQIFENFVSGRQSTFAKRLQMKKEQKEMSNKNKQDVEPLKQELHQVISTMGPDTPQLNNLNDETTSTETAQKIYVQKDEAPPTAREISEMSSIPTDTADPYYEIRTCQPCGLPYHNKEKSFRKSAGTAGSKLNRLSNFLGFKEKNGNTKEYGDLYKINILQPTDSCSPPRKVIFDLVEDLPKPCMCNTGTNTMCPAGGCNHSSVRHSETTVKNQALSRGTGGIERANYSIKGEASDKVGAFNKQTFYSGRPDHAEGLNRVDVYYFDHGCSAYYHTTDSPPIIMTEILAERTEQYTTKFWAEVFGSLQIGFAFFTAFILQLLRFILQSLVRPLLIGTVQLVSDYCFKPCLATIFNAIVQPPLIFVYNVCTSLRDICDPIAEGMGYFIREVSVILRVFRIVDVKKEIKYGQSRCSESISAYPC